MIKLLAVFFLVFSLGCRTDSGSMVRDDEVPNSLSTPTAAIAGTYFNPDTSGAWVGGLIISAANAQRFDFRLFIAAEPARQPGGGTISGTAFLVQDTKDYWFDGPSGCSLAFHVTGTTSVSVTQNGTCTGVLTMGAIFDGTYAVIATHTDQSVPVEGHFTDVTQQGVTKDLVITALTASGFHFKMTVTGPDIHGGTAEADAVILDGHGTFDDRRPVGCLFDFAFAGSSVAVAQGGPCLHWSQDTLPVNFASAYSH